MAPLLAPDALGPARGARAARLRTVLWAAAGPRARDGADGRAELLALARGPARDLVLVAARWDDDVRRGLPPRREAVLATAREVTRALDAALADVSTRSGAGIEARRDHAVATACALLDRPPGAILPRHARGSASEAALWVFDGVLGALVALRWERPDVAAHLASALGCAAVLQLAASG